MKHLLNKDASLPCWEQEAEIGEIQFMNQSGEEAMCNLLNNGFSNPFLSSLAFAWLSGVLKLIRIQVENGGLEESEVSSLCYLKH